jgi:hypothetical protein
MSVIYDVQISVRVAREHDDLINDIAAQTGLSRSDVVRLSMVAGLYMFKQGISADLPRLLEIAEINRIALTRMANTFVGMLPEELHRQARENVTDFHG